MIEQQQEEQIGFEIEPDVESHAQTREHAHSRQRLALQMLRQTRDSLTHVIQLLETGDTARATRQLVDFVSQKKATDGMLTVNHGSRVVEGVFDGRAMIGADGVRYEVPENYASKSKLVEGDMLKLIIGVDGHHVFKQIGPIERMRVVGTLQVDDVTQEPVVVCAHRVYKVLGASISYFKCIPGDELAVTVPKGGTCVWAAIERVNQ